MYYVEFISIDYFMLVIFTSFNSIDFHWLYKSESMLIEYFVFNLVVKVYNILLFM